MNLRNRLIWIALLTVAFAGVQLFASRRKADRELGSLLSDKLMPIAQECVRLPSSRGSLTLQVKLVPEGKLHAAVERIEVPASSQVQDPALTECIRERAKTLTIPEPLRSPEQLQLTLTL